MGKPYQLIEKSTRADEPDPKVATQKWAMRMLPIVAGPAGNQQLAEVLSQWAAALVVQSRVQTCEACFDRKAADATRALFKHLGVACCNMIVSVANSGGVFQ
jgi:hypothetical protein